MKCWEVCGMGAGHFTRMHKTFPCWSWTPALCSCKDDNLRLEKRAKFLPWGSDWTAEGAEGASGSEMWSQFSTRPSLLRLCRATLHLHTDFSPPSDSERDLMNTAPHPRTVWSLHCCDNVGLSTLSSQSCNSCPTQELTLSQVRPEHISTGTGEPLQELERGHVMGVTSSVKYSGADNISAEIVQANLHGIELVWIYI